MYTCNTAMIISAIKNLICCPWLWQHTTPVLRFGYVLPASEWTLCGSSASLSTKKEMYIASHRMRSVFNTLLQKRSTLLFLWVTENFYSSCDNLYPNYIPAPTYKQTRNENSSILEITESSRLLLGSRY